jgi:hypothetical protein
MAAEQIGATTATWPLASEGTSKMDGLSNDESTRSCTRVSHTRRQRVYKLPRVEPLQWVRGTCLSSAMALFVYSTNRCRIGFG